MNKIFKIKFKEDVYEGLQKYKKTLPCKYFYDENGSKLFDQICLLKEYYPTKTEIDILNKSILDIAKYLGKQISVYEFGAGSANKIRILLDNLPIINYFPIDISIEYLNKFSKLLSNEYPKVSINPVFGDFTKNIIYPKEFVKNKNKMGFFPGSTIGNFNANDAGNILKSFGQFLGNNSKLLIGVDLKKDEDILTKAYNDKSGITAKFNLNLLLRINKELNADFDIDEFKHLAVYNQSMNRIEMHLISQKKQTVKIGEKKFNFKLNESIHTENSYKYTTDEFKKLAKNNLFQTERIWLDENKLFSIFLLRFENK